LLHGVLLWFRCNTKLSHATREAEECSWLDEAPTGESVIERAWVIAVTVAIAWRFRRLQDSFLRLA